MNFSSFTLKADSDNIGKVQLMDFNCTYNGAPRLVMDLPQNRSLDEDTAELHLIDLSLYLEDDYLEPTELSYSIVPNPNTKSQTFNTLYICEPSTILTSGPGSGNVSRGIV